MDQFGWHRQIQSCFDGLNCMVNSIDSPADILDFVCYPSQLALVTPYQGLLQLAALDSIGPSAPNS